MNYTGQTPDTEPGREWLTQASCRAEDPETFFPDNNVDRIAQAKAVCATCPVRRECLIDCMAQEGSRSAKSRWGVYAGLTPRQRERLYHRLRQRKARAKAAA